MSDRRIKAMQGLIAATGTDIVLGSGVPANGISGTDIFGLFNIVVGLMVVAAILAFVGGLIVWAVRLGTIGRNQGIRIMEWGVVILFVLVVLRAIVQYFTSHPAAVTILVSAVIILFIVWIVLQIIRSGGEEEEH